MEERLTALGELPHRGPIRPVGLRNVTSRQFLDARKNCKIVCVQNFFHIAQRDEDAFVDELRTQGVAYAPFFPLGGFTPLQPSALDGVQASAQATPMQVALAWLLHRAPNILLIPGASSVQHLRENLQVARCNFLRKRLQSSARAQGAPSNDLE